MFCSNCGARMEEGQRFCSNCGAAQTCVTAPEIKPKKKRKALGWIIGLVVVLALAALGFWKRDAVANLVARTLSSPEVYYRHVETRNAQRLAAAIAERRGAVIELTKESQSSFLETEMKRKILSLIVIFALLLSMSGCGLCPHIGTHVEGAKAATCSQAGYTGDTICNL